MPEREDRLPVSQDLIRARELMGDLWGQEMSKVALDVSWFRSGLALARWLVSQLPGTNPEVLGWGLIAVATMLYPPWYDPQLGDILKPADWPPGRGKGASIALLEASRVGEELISIGMGNPSPAPAPAALEVGDEMAAIDFGQLITEQGLVSRDRLADLRAENDDSAEIRQVLLDGMPGADLRAIGWALVAAAVLVMNQALGSPVPRGFGRRARWRRGARTGSVIAALSLGMIGEGLTREASPG